MPTSSGVLHVRTAGQGEDVVLLHGLGDSSLGWRKVEASLRGAGYRVTTVDALGAGSSAKPADGDYRIGAHVERLRQVLDARGIARAHLCGNSLGGSEALIFAVLHPERVASLLLVNPAAYPEGGWLGNWFWEHADLTAAVLERLPPKAIALVALGMNYGNPLRISREDLAVYGEAAAVPGALRAFVQQERSIDVELQDLFEYVPRMRSIQAPVLVLWGTRDRILPAAHAELLAELPQARIVRLEGVGHAAQLEAPERFLAEALPFLQSVATRAVRHRRAP